MAFALVAGLGFEVEAEQRLGVRRPEVEPPRVELDGQPVEVVLAAVGVSSADLGEHGIDVVDVGVDLAALRVALVRDTHLGQHVVGASQLGEHLHRGDESGVGAVVRREVVVRRVLAAEHRSGLSHLLLDERVPDPVRTGTPPFSAITSGTAREQIRLYRIVAPG